MSTDSTDDSNAIGTAQRKIAAIDSVKDVARMIENALVNLGLAGMFLMMVLVTANAVGRYLFDQPISGVYEATELFLMVMTIFLVTASLQREEGNINVDILSRRFPPIANTVRQFLTRVATLVIFTTITFLAFDRSIEAYVNDWWTTGVIPFPVYASWAIMVVGLGLFCVRLLLQINDNLFEMVRYVR